MMRSTILLLLTLTVSAFGQAFPGTAAYQAAFLKPAAGGGGGPTLVAQDNFDSYADGSLLASSSNWDAAGANNGTWVRNTVGDGSIYGSGNNSLLYYTTASFNSDQRSEATIDAAGSTGFSWTGVTVRVQAGVQTGYWLMCNANQIYLYSFNSGTPTLVRSDSAVTLAPGNRIALEATGVGTATRLRVQVDTGSGWVDHWSSENPTDDIDGGKPGVGGSTGGDTFTRMDDWKGYNL
jgi:hypothetical protein